MDSDMWISRLIAAKRQHSIQNHQNLVSDRLNVDEFESEDEVRQDLCCPYCYEDHDIVSLCAHLEEEHQFESTGAVCPVCSVDVMKDMFNHITEQHGHLFKIPRRRVLHKFTTPSSQAFSLLGRDLRGTHLQVLLGKRRSNNSASATIPDPFVSSLLLNFPTSEEDHTSKASSPDTDESYMFTESSLPQVKSSLELSLTIEEREKRRSQANSKANFVQNLVLSALFGDL